MKMKLIAADTPIPPELKGAVITLGNFDGLHIGHQELVLRMKALAKDLNAPSLLMTFDPHPVKFLHPGKGFQELFPLEDLVEQVAARDVDAMVVKTFDGNLARLEHQMFLQKVILEGLAPKAIVVGHDFRFGHNRQGDFETLKRFFADRNVRVERVEPVAVNGQIISSSLIRENLLQGHVENAQQFLGRPFELRGRVVDGEKRGRRLGFPTANLNYDNEIVPKVGVYVTEFMSENQGFQSLTNIGFRPTFKGETRAKTLTVETYLLDSDKDLYERPVRVRFLKRVRDEMVFSGPESLIAQIQKDITMARDFFKRSNV